MAIYVDVTVKYLIPKEEIIAKTEEYLKTLFEDGTLTSEEIEEKAKAYILNFVEIKRSEDMACKPKGKGKK